MGAIIGARRITEIQVVDSSFQDDEREADMRNRFSLNKDPNQGRSGTDAYLELDGLKIPFELKTTSTKSVTTVRDFGPDHIEKWQGKHWLFGFYGLKDYVFYKYASPKLMEPWIREKEAYIRIDFDLSDRLYKNLSSTDLYTYLCSLLGEKEIYSYFDTSPLRTSMTPETPAIPHSLGLKVENDYFY